jgi:hypothetical protein
LRELETTGFEFLVTWNAVQKNNFNYSTTLNFSTFSTKIKSLTSGELSFGNGGVLYRANMGAPGQNDTRLVRVKEGEPFGDLWGPVWDGTSLTTSGDAPGTPIFEDLDGSGGDYCNATMTEQLSATVFQTFHSDGIVPFSLAKAGMQAFSSGVRLVTIC